MKLATFIDPATHQKCLGVVRPGGMIDIRAAAQTLNQPVPATTVKTAVCSGPAILEAVAAIAAEGERHGLALDIDSLVLCAPIPDPSKFLCIGKNNRKHREELLANDMLNELPDEPTGFVKLHSTICGQDAEIERPDGITMLDYEPELVFVITKRAYRVAKADAMEHVGAITLFNDVSAREIQKREVASGSRFWTAKNMPNFSPIGPFVVTRDEVEDPDDLWVTCHVNGERRLRENTSDYIYKIGDIIEHFSRYMPLEAGDLVAMGAPKGVAVGQPNAEALYLKPGDKMEIAIEGLMSLRNTIIAPD